MRRSFAGLVSTACLLAACALPGAARAQSWSNASGLITNVSLSYEGNYAFRVTLSSGGANPLASCRLGFAYINKLPNENYEAKVASLLTANSLGKIVNISYVADQDGFCKITDMNF